MRICASVPSVTSVRASVQPDIQALPSGPDYPTENYQRMVVAALHAARRHVSMDSPLARVLMGRRRDDEVTAEVPGGRRTFVVTAIRYDENGASD